MVGARQGLLKSEHRCEAMMANDQKHFLTRNAPGMFQTNNLSNEPAALEKTGAANVRARLAQTDAASGERLRLEPSRSCRLGSPRNG